MKLNTTLIGYGVISVFFATILGAVGYWSIYQLNTSMNSIVNSSEALQAQMRADIMHEALHADVLALDTALDGAESASVKAAQADIEVHSKILHDNLTKAAAVESSAQVKQDFIATMPQMDAYIAAAKDISNIATTTVAASDNTVSIKKTANAITDKNRMLAFNEKMPQFTAQYHSLGLTMGELSKHMIEYNATAEAVGNQAGSIGKKTMLFGTILIIIIAIFIARYIRHRIMNMLGGEPEQVLDVAKEIARGNLSNDINVIAGDRTSLLATIDDMQYNLRKLISQIQISAESISSGAQQISSGNTDLSQRTEEQASSLEETASSMEEMASTVKQNAENAKQANMMAGEASSVAVKGGEAIGKVVNTMSAINSSSKKIVDIISVIDGIAFQTNILALNAAVEAARAGEQGRGFAVVAAEVRNLAHRSATAAKEIKQLIGESVDNVQAGAKLVDDAGDTMTEIVMAVKMVTDIVNEIAAASQEQSAGIDQVNNAITNMDEVTQQNAALVEEAAAAASSLEGKAQELTDATSMFRLGTDSDYEAIGNAQNNATQNNLNELKTHRNAELGNNKTANAGKRLKAPKAKKDEEWEEF